MTDSQWFLRRLAGGMPIEDAQRIAALFLRLEDEEIRSKAYIQEDGLHSAMLADIAEIFFGDDCNKETFGHVPTILSHTHAGWACSPVPEKNGSWLRAAMIQWAGKKGLTENDIKSFEQWEDFLKILERLKGATPGE